MRPDPWTQHVLDAHGPDAYLDVLADRDRPCPSARARAEDWWDHHREGK